MQAIAIIGMFDGVHLGHQALIAQAKSIAAESGLRTLVCTFPAHPLATIRPELTPPCLTPAPVKCNLLLEAGADEVRLFDFTPQLKALTAEEFMRMLKEQCGVSHLLMGFNHRFGADGKGDFSHYRQAGEKAGINVLLSTVKAEVDGHTISSTAIREAIKNGEMQSAAAMLGRGYCIDGIVQHGRQIGRTIGFPTANVAPAFAGQLIPPTGAYAAIATTADGQSHPAMVNIGHRPTIAHGLPATIEAHLIGYSGDLYGRPLTLAFADRLRPERRFDSLDSLQAQLRQDLDRATQILNQA